MVKISNDEFIKYETNESSAPLLLNVSMPTTEYYHNQMSDELFEIKINFKFSSFYEQI